MIISVWIEFAVLGISSPPPPPPPWLDSPIEFQPPERAGSHRAEHSRMGVDALALDRSQRCVYFIVYLAQLTAGALTVVGNYTIYRICSIIEPRRCILPCALRMLHHPLTCSLALVVKEKVFETICFELTSSWTVVWESSPDCNRIWRWQLAVSTVAISSQACQMSRCYTLRFARRARGFDNHLRRWRTCAIPDMV